jgi:dTDP-glucose 4,6-dehydratase
MRTYLVSGGAGFIGSNFVLYLLRSMDIRVINLDKLTYAGNLMNLESLKDNPSHIFVHGDIKDRKIVGRLLKGYRPSSIVNFAAESHVDRSIDGPEDFIQTNVVGTFHLLEEVRPYWDSLQGKEKESFRFLHVSADGVYGSLSPEGTAFNEETPYAPK